MKSEKILEECEFNLNQIKYFDPDPYYVNYFFNLFIESVNKIYNEIFKEASIDFGLFIAENSNKEKFYEKALIKKDKKAIEFFNWFENKYKEEHKTSYPKFIKTIIEFKKKYQKLPKIKIMIRAKERYSKDNHLEILIGLTNNKLRNKGELEMEVKRNIPVFLQIINKKRLRNNEPKVNSKQVTVSAFIQINNEKEYEISYASEKYISVLNRFLNESTKIKQEILN